VWIDKERRKKMKNPSIGGVRRGAGTILVFLAGLVLIGSATAKLAQVPVVVSQMDALGFAGNKLMIIAALEILSAVLFLVPRTRPFGVLMVSAYMGGAISAHMGHNEPVYQPAIILVLAWLGARLRHPEYFSAFNRNTSGASQLKSSEPARA